MQKSLLTLAVSLALCGAAAAAIVATNARAAQDTRKPMMVAMMPGGDLQLAANTPGRDAMHDHGMTPSGMAAHRKEFCREFYAHAAGRLAFTEAKLDLTAAQQPLFDRWKAVKLDIAKRRQTACETGHFGHRREADASKRPSPVERMARQEERLKQHLADLDNERPALEAVYNTLTPAQKMDLSFGEHGFGMRREGGMMGRRMFAQGPRMMHGPMGMEGRMGGDHPPGPPPPGAPPPSER